MRCCVEWVHWIPREHVKLERNLGAKHEG
jgi:hypothetical protein